ncbi:hypothetical protein EQH57_0410, partial [Dictyocoela roeselum]
MPDCFSFLFKSAHFSSASSRNYLLLSEKSGKLILFGLRSITNSIESAGKKEDNDTKNIDPQNLKTDTIASENISPTDNIDQYPDTTKSIYKELQLSNVELN